MSDTLISIARTTMYDLLEMLGMHAEVEVSLIEGEENNKKYLEIKLEMDPELALSIVGQYGTSYKLEALTTIVSMCLPSEEAQGCSVIIDINNGRQKRIDYLRSLAIKTIEEVISSNKPVTLRPMLPWERRVIHMALDGRTDVFTQSVGEGEERSVAIHPADII